MDAIAVAVIVTYLIAATAIGSVHDPACDDVHRLGGRRGRDVRDSGGGRDRRHAHRRGRHLRRRRRRHQRAGSGNLWWYGISTFLALALVGLFFAVYYRRLRLQTVGEIFTIRWATRRCQWLTSLCVQTEYVIVNLIEAYVIGVIVSTLTPLPMLAGVLIAAAIFATYVSLSGLWGTAITNLIHCSVVLVGLLSVGADGHRPVRGLGGRDRRGRRAPGRDLPQRRGLVGLRGCGLAPGLRDDLLGRDSHPPPPRSTPTMRPPPATSGTSCPLSSRREPSRP